MEEHFLAHWIWRILLDEYSETQKRKKIKQKITTSIFWSTDIKEFYRLYCNAYKLLGLYRFLFKKQKTN